MVRAGLAEEVRAELPIPGCTGGEQYKGPSGKGANKSISILWKWWLIQLAGAEGAFEREDESRNIGCFYMGKSL